MILVLSCVHVYAIILNFLADLLTMTPHTPTPEPVRYDKKDGQWYTHDGVDVKETQSRKGERICLYFLNSCTH